MRPLAWAALAALAAGCRIAVDLAEYDRMQRELGVRSVLRGEGFTLWSPQNWVSTRDWFQLLEQELPAVRRALGLAPEATPHVQVLLREVEGLQPLEFAADGAGLSFTATHRPHPLHGVAGWAVEDEIAIPIAPARLVRLEDGREITSVMSAETYRSVVRHELAHALLHGRGLPEDDWFSEGAAELIEGLELVEGELLDAGAPGEALRLARDLDLLERPLADLLDWREDGAAVAAGRESVDAAGRVLCGLYVRWAIGLSGERAPARGLLGALSQLARRSRAQHLAEEAGWHAWLAAQAAGAGIPRASDYTPAPQTQSPAPPVPATEAPR
jgi:hypothetical protein